jgi:site-specific recombinase XerD
VLGGVLEKLCTWLQGKGFPLNAIRRRIVAARFLDECLRARGVLSLSGCTALQLKACLPREKRWTPQIAYSLGRSLLEYLQERGELATVASTPSEQVVAAYRDYLQRVRGLAPRTARRHAVMALRFLRFLKYDDRSDSLRNLRVAEIDAFVTHEGRRVGRITMQKLAAMLRSFLKFLAAREEAPAGLATCVESPRQFRGERLARALPWDQVLSLVRTVDRSTLKGCRDYAMLLLIAAYGLRAAEVAALELDDIAWRSRVIRVPRPKIGTPLVVPLTDEVATALLEYLRHRGHDDQHRRLFFRVRAPKGPIESTAVCDVFDAWAARAGLALPALGGAHCLRHSLAMHLLRQKTPIKTIGDLLGHRSVESTGIYLRLHVEDLRDVALPLPRSGREVAS